MAITDAKAVQQLLFISLAGDDATPGVLDLTVRELNALKVELAAALQAVGVVNLASSPHELTVHAYGPDADALWAEVEPIIGLLRIPIAGTVLRRYGGPGAREVQTRLPHAAG